MENAALILGPYKIEGGNNRNWSSTCEHSYIDDKYLTDKLKSKIPSTPDIFSLIICIAPAEMVTRCDLFSIPPGVSARTCKEGGTAWITQKQQQQHAEYKEGMRDSTGDDGSPGSRSVATSSAMKMGGRTASGTAVGASSSGSDDGHKDRDRDPYIAVKDYDFYAEKQADMKLKKKPSTPDLPAPGCASDGQNQNATPKSQFPPPLTQKINSKSVSVHSADVFHSQNYDKLSMVICEVSYVRMVSPKISESTRTTSSEQHVDSTDQQYNIMTPSAPTSTSTAAAASPSSLEVKCVMQRVQMSCGVFLTQDIYGMDRNCVEEEPEPIPDPHNAEDDASGSGDDEVRAPPATTPAGITLDSDAIECVICLTDPRIIAVYPCRHMCLCASCAEVLPSQVPISPPSHPFLSHHCVLSVCFSPSSEVCHIVVWLSRSASMGSTRQAVTEVLNTLCFVSCLHNEITFLCNVKRTLRLPRRPVLHCSPPHPVISHQVATLHLPHSSYYYRATSVPFADEQRACCSRSVPRRSLRKVGSSAPSALQAH